MSESGAESVAVSENMSAPSAATVISTADGESVPDAGANPSEVSQNAGGMPDTPKADAGANGATAPPQEPNVQSPAETPKQNTASFTVDCKNAIDYGILENPNFAGILPQNGVIFSDGNVQFSEGESVMTVLKRALKSQKIACSVPNGYVRSIAGLSEKDCGETSGWLYRVNGKLPTVSCKFYTLQAGDRVEFIYTCRMGDVSET